MRTPLQPESLGPEFIHQVVYCMENQNEEYVLDLDTLELRETSEIDFDDPDLDTTLLIDIPLWNPSDGFRIMEEFTTSLGNPYYRNKLRQVMVSGHGVFRNFKNVLREAPWLTERWHTFKNDYMERIVIEWMKESDALRELLVLQEEGFQEDTEDIIFEDFSVSSMQQNEQPEVCTFLQRVQQESPRLLHSDAGDKAEIAPLLMNTEVAIVRDPEGDLVALLAVREFAPNRYITAVAALDARVEGIGLWEYLIEHAVSGLKKRGAQEYITSEIPYQEHADGVLHQFGFVRKSVRYAISFEENEQPHKGAQ